MISVDVLVLVVIAPAVRRSARTPGILRYGGKNRAEVADVLRSSSAWRLSAKFSLDVALPQIRRFHDVHVAVENLETVLCHCDFPCFARSVMPLKVPCQANP